MSFRVPLLAAAALAAVFAAVAAPAQAAGDPDGLLSVLPSDAKPGVCYARVKAPATVAPPTPGHGRWVLSPPPPGAPGPLWCLVIEPGQSAKVVSPEHFGWIRVLCDDQQTPVRISGLQRRLHAGGEYAGEVSGKYDEATAAAVARWQDRHHIDHGGYLSMTTVESIEHAELSGPPPLAWRQGYTPQTIAAGGAPCCLRPVIPPPPPPVVTIRVPVPVPVPAPCCTAGGYGQPYPPAQQGWGGYPGEGRGRQGYGGGGLTWPGKVG